MSSGVRRRGSIAVEGEQILRQRGVAHQVADAALAHQAGVVEIAALLDADQVGDLRRQEHAGVAARGDAGWNRFAGGDQFIETHRYERARSDRPAATAFQTGGRSRASGPAPSRDRRLWPPGPASRRAPCRSFGIVALGSRDYSSVPPARACGAVLQPLEPNLDLTLAPD